ncbi:MAG TPA: hypothetical protein VH682_20650 [Gemmataceae bacterium]|jgi:hypothetical protein
MATKRVGRGWHLLGIVCVFSLVGCGGEKRVPVVGTVTLDGKPLNGGILTFAPDSAKGNMAQITCTSPVKNGHYELQTIGITRSKSGSGVPPGWYKVTWMNPKMGTRKQPLAPIEVNEKYMSAEKTPLGIEVKDNPEPGAYDLKLTK